ncbi:hypothetical protein LTR37_009396 [Vermiconidia calcicola]|uniref:Uncharacterized protein n=1 Tax=Vermiconidia calcicola TaxID=1690605 RepID=A0ACC3N870_9PEZI|nr:hypothetical protein LTR37_009396 [Vermiconidia calcicola]
MFNNVLPEQIRTVATFFLRGRTLKPRRTAERAYSSTLLIPSMSTTQQGGGPMAYRPTSLDFINRPNPVEPHAVPEKHPLNGTPRLDNSSTQDLLRPFLRQNVDSHIERPAKRRKPGDSKALDLPRLPTVRNGAKRLRIPPTLSGLHQPPPDAGLLPSMSVDQPVKLCEQPVAPEPRYVADSQMAVPTSKIHSEVYSKPPSQQESTRSKPKRNKWTDAETKDLLKGVAKFGIDYKFERRTALDLKDRFRICCPDDYRTKRKSKQYSDHQAVLHSKPASPVEKGSGSSRSERKSSLELRDIGIAEPFKKSNRRKRTAYSVAEDQALLKGFQKYGNTWAAIQQDVELSLGHRKSTDLRDRFRTRFPEHYEKAGLTPRPASFPKRPDRGDEQVTEDEREACAPVQEVAVAKPSQYKSEAPRTGREAKESLPAKALRKQIPTSLLHDSDVFWGAPFDSEDTENERITLDRRILDWPSNLPKPAASVDQLAKSGTDSFGTLNTQRPAAPPYTAQPTGTVAALPSLAAITAGSDDSMVQFELPSLLGNAGHMEDGRQIGQFATLDDLLS